jgi:quercetin dioxygenase-like cupin family protein
MLVLIGGIQVVRADHLPVHGTILARGPFTEELDLKVKARIGDELQLVQVDDAADTIVQQITGQPGGFTGWHSHPGPAFVTVAQGTFTYYAGDDASCTGIPYGPGESFVDPGQGHVHAPATRDRHRHPVRHVLRRSARDDQPVPRCPEPWQSPF